MTAGIAFRRTLSMGNGRPLTRARFLGRLRSITGAPTRLWLPKASDTTTFITDDATAASGTYSATIAGRTSTLGRGVAVSFASASSQNASIPDAADLSFGNGTTDSAFSLLLVANVTDTAAARVLVAKYDNGGAQREWFLRVSATDLLALAIYDESLDVIPVRTSDAAITQGSWCVFGATYSAATGGATAANDMALYQNGAAIASTATNAGTYVAMEAGTSPVTIGSLDAVTGQFLDGSLALIGIYPTALSATVMAQAYAECRRYFGI